MTLFTRKSIAALRADAETSGLKRALGPLNLTTLGIGSIIGTGIFVLTGQAAAMYAGPAVVLSMVVAGVASEDDVRRWDRAFHEVQTAPVPPTIFAPVFTAVGRRPA